MPPPPSNRQAPTGALTHVPGIEVGHFTDTRRPTGCTVILAREGAVGGVDVRGAAPGTRETDLLAPGNLVERVHGIMLAGGSAWGLAAAEGAMQWLEERGIGLDAHYARVPLVLLSKKVVDRAAGSNLARSGSITLVTSSSLPS